MRRFRVGLGIDGRRRGPIGVGGGVSLGGRRGVEGRRGGGS